MRGDADFVFAFHGLVVLLFVVLRQLRETRGIEERIELLAGARRLRGKGRHIFQIIGPFLHISAAPLRLLPETEQFQPADSQLVPIEFMRLLLPEAVAEKDLVLRRVHMLP